MKTCNAEIGDSIFFACNKEKDLEIITSLARNKIAKDLGLIDENTFAFCWIVDYPMYERDEETKRINFSSGPYFFWPSKKFIKFRSKFSKKRLLLVNFNFEDISSVTNGIIGFKKFKISLNTRLKLLEISFLFFSFFR